MVRQASYIPPRPTVKALCPASANIKSIVYGRQAPPIEDEPTPLILVTTVMVRTMAQLVLMCDRHHRRD